MAPVPTFVKVGYLDSAERIAEVTYRLAESMEDDGSNITDVLDAVADLETALNVLTWDHIEYVDLVARAGGGGAAPNVAANNQVFAFTRTTLSGGDYGFFEVPAWDDLVFDQDSNNLLSAAYNTAAAAVAALILDPETGETMTVNWSQSRARKSRKKQIS